MIPRLLEKRIAEKVKTKKILLILGARQVGKTTLLNLIKNKFYSQKKVLYLNCDIEEDRKTINTTSLTELKKLNKKIDILMIDEAQRLDNPGLTLKIIYDNLNTKIIVTGSSSFELKNKLSDSLTGRYIDFILYPFSFKEIQTQISNIEKTIIYGLYPEVFLIKKITDKILFLNKIIESYLFKDILSFQRVRNSQALKDLLTALAYQIGSEVNENELSNRLKIDRKTVIAYLDILEKSFIIKRLYPYSKNPRREIGRRYKIYFVDLGIRNALIGDFNDFNLRKDSGVIWENFIVIEKIKSLENQAKLKDIFFWRSYNGGEIDLIEKSKTTAKMNAFEIKYQNTKISRGANEFLKEYLMPINIINIHNYQKFI
ncbi:MAG: hypothetical protein ACD_12C00636G0001 [uncultured bacterium]|nr:MAG: hypothetical protein ACD_12C00636G0001 [uncultured bacterium]